MDSLRKWGRASCGVTLATTKSGNERLSRNRFRQDKSMNANTWNSNRNGWQNRITSTNSAGNIGGPIGKRTKRFSFSDYHGQRNTTPNTVILTDTPPVATDPLSVAGYKPTWVSKYLTSYANALLNNVYLGESALRAVCQLENYRVSAT